jgi:hypothetical protein
MRSMPEPLPCRSVAEAHLYLDLIGAERAGRAQRLEARGDDLVSVYTVTLDGRRREIAFLSPEDPLGVRGFGGAEASEIIDPAQWILHADRLAASVPGDPSQVQPAGHAEVARRLEEAARCLDEVQKFLPKGQEAMPAEVFGTPVGKVTYLRDPGRFRRSRLEAVARTYREIAQRFAGAS